MHIECSSADIEVKKQIESFLNTLGVSISKSIYIISDSYMSINNGFSNLMLENSILVLKDGWRLEDLVVDCIEYTENQELFLNNLCYILNLGDLSKIINIYLRSDTKVSDLSKLRDDSDILRFCITYFKYVENLTNKDRGIQYSYNTNDLLDSLSNLDNSEKVILLRAKIHLNLRDEWRLAYDLLLDCNSVESKLLRGRIMLYNYCRPEASIKILDDISDEGLAKYELGVAYNNLGSYSKAINYFKESISSLDDIDYINKAYDNIIFIYRYRFCDGLTASMYEESKTIKGGL